VSVNLVCTGCGAALQMEDENARGYVTSTAFLREQPLCKRCYQLLHYGKFTPSSVTEDEYRTTVMRALTRPSLVLYVVDLFDFNGSIVRGLSGSLRDHEVWLVANKVDLLPSELNRERLSSWLLREARRLGVEVAQVFLVSAKTGEGIDILWEAVTARARSRQAVAVGMANVGKSSVLNRLLEQAGQLEGQPFTTSPYPGTTLSGFTLKLGGSGVILTDTPGLLGKFRLQDRVCQESLKTIIANDRVRPRVFQLQPGQSLFLGGLVRLDFLSGAAQPFIVYAANQLTVHRTKLSSADELYQRQRGALLNPPCERCDTSLQTLKSKNMSFLEGKPVDVVIPGLGWIRLSGKTVKLHLHTPEGIDPSVRPALGSRMIRGGGRPDRQWRVSSPRRRP